MSEINSTFKNSSNEVALVESNSCPSGVQLVNPYRVNKALPDDLIQLAREIQNADKFVQANVSNKLTVIAEQVRFLQQQARRILEESRESYDLHHVPCNFVKKPGQVYSLYQRDSGQKYFSMLSPEDWGSSCPHKYLGAFRLEPDQSWTPEEKFEEVEQNQVFINKILHSSNALKDAITN